LSPAQAQEIILPYKSLISKFEAPSATSASVSCSPQNIVNSFTPF